MRVAVITVMPLLLALASGCAHYEYDLVQPADFATHIGSKADAVVRIDPLEYRLRTADSHLVMQIHNPTQDPITLRGDRSTVVDPSGQSHPLRSQTIAPGTFVKLIFPPMKPQVEPYPGPLWGVGVGGAVRVDSRRRFIAPPSPLDPTPRYLDIYDESSALYWDWGGETNVRMTLVYQRGEKEFTHQFEFHRKRM